MVSRVVPLYSNRALYCNDTEYFSDSQLLKPAERSLTVGFAEPRDRTDPFHLAPIQMTCPNRTIRHPLNIKLNSLTCFPNMTSSELLKTHRALVLSEIGKN